MNTLLVGVLLLQSVLFITLKDKGYWEFPKWVVLPVVHFFNETDMDIDFDRIQIYPQRGIIVSDLKVYSDECLCPVIRLGETKISYTNRQEIENSLKISIRDGVVYYPDPYLPEKDNLKLVDNFSVQISKDNDQLKIAGFRANVAKLKVASINSISIPISHFAFEKQVNDTPDSLTDKSAFLDKLRQLRYVYQYFESSENALLTFYLNTTGDALVDGVFNLYSDGAVLSEKTISKRLFCFGEFRITDHFSLLDGIHGKLESLKHDQYRVEDIVFWAKYDDVSVENLLPKEVLLQATALDLDGRAVDFLSVRWFPDSLRSGDLDVQTAVMRESLDLGIQYDLDQHRVLLDFEGEIQPLKILKSGWLKRDLDLSLFDVEQIYRLAGEVEFGQDFKLNDARFDLVAENVIIKGTDFPYARGSGSFQDQTLVLDEFAACDHGHLLRGSLFRSLNTTEYRYMLKGVGIPTELNSMFKSWWSNTWNSFEFHEAPVFVDLDIWGVNNDQSQRYAYGEIALEDIIYKGVQLDHGSVILNVASKFTHLFGMNVFHPRGCLTGEFMTVFRPKEKGTVSQRLDIVTDVPLHELAPLVGSELDVYVENTNADIQPIIHVYGCLVTDGIDEFSHLEALHIDVSSKKPVEFFGVTLDQIEVSVIKKENEVLINPARFSFANGQGSGEFFYKPSDRGNVLDFKVQIVDFDYRVAADNVAVIREKKEEKRAEQILSGNVEPVEETKLEPSFMDLQLAGNVVLGDWSSLSASGYIDLDDPLIQRVHMLGGFSKLLNNMGMSIGSFSLTKATSPLTLEGKKIFFDDLELTGPSSQVRSKGVIDLQANTLDFRLKSYPLREVEFPVIAGLAFMLRPFTQMFEVKASGALDDPEWKLVIDPSRL